MSTVVGFHVFGIPATQGSKRAFVPKGGKRPVIVEDCARNKDWRGDVQRAAIDAYEGAPMEGPFRLEISFQLPRPKGHYNKKGELRRAAPVHPTTKPDNTKMLRALEDALKGLIWKDDSQVVQHFVRKSYATAKPGAAVRITQLEG